MKAKASKKRKSGYPRLRVRGGIVVTEYAEPAEPAPVPTVKLSVNFHPFGGRFYRRGSAVAAGLVPAHVLARFANPKRKTTLVHAANFSPRHQINNQGRPEDEEKSQDGPRKGKTHEH